METIVRAAVAALLLPYAASQNVVSLEGNGWTLSNNALNISVPANLPSQAHLDLYANQVIGDPYYGLNDFNLRWVAWSNWTYTSDPVSLNNSNSTATWLLFNGLDTFASIAFCGQHVASTDNQFRQYWFDVSNIANACTNATDQILSINFGSAPLIANEIAAQPGQETWPTLVQQVFEFPNRWFIRKGDLSHTSRLQVMYADYLYQSKATSGGTGVQHSPPLDRGSRLGLCSWIKARCMCATV